MLPENPENMRVCELVTLAMLGRELANLALNMATWSSSGSRIKPSFFGNMAIYFIQVGAWQLGREKTSFPGSCPIPEAAFLFPRFLL